MRGRRDQNGRISIEEAEQRRRIVQRARAHGRLEGIRHNPAGDAVFDAYIRGEISATDIVPRLREQLRPR